MNISAVVCDQRADEQPTAVAVVEHRAGRRPVEWTFAGLRTRSQMLAARLSSFGVGRGDRVAITLPQSGEALAWHLAILRIGAISVPIPAVFAGEAVRSRLRDCRARLHVTTETAASDLTPPADAAERPAPVEPDDPAFIFYTSGSTGPPKGIVIGHRILSAVGPGFERVFELALRPGDVFWTPSDWSWLGALCEVVLPALARGYPVVACPERFSIPGMYEILERHRVSCAFLVPHVLRRVCADPPPPSVDLHLRAVMTGGEKMSPTTQHNAACVLGAPINDDFGLTEATHLAVGCSALHATPPGAVGRAVPGREIAILDRDGNPCAAGIQGEIAVNSGDPVVMLGYWDRPQETAERLRGGWLHTGDRGRIDTEGFLWFDGREDDCLKVAGMLISPEEIETAICTHPDVIECGVTTTHEAGNDAAIAAFVQLRPSVAPSARLAAALRDLVRAELAAHAYPETVHFVAELPHTSTGKVLRRELRQIEGGVVDG